MASRRVLLVNLGLLVVCAAVVLSRTDVQDYLLSRSPRERLMNHFKEFEKKVARDPEIRRALQEPSLDGRSERLQAWSRRGAARLDDRTLLERARIMSAIYSRMSDRACARAVRGSPFMESDRAEFEEALLRLEAEGVAKWMECLHKAMLAEVRQAPRRMVTRRELVEAFGALERKIGRDPAMRVDTGLDSGASDAELAWATRTVYAAAPTLAAPHGTALLRLMERSYEETSRSDSSRAEAR